MCACRGWCQQLPQWNVKYFTNHKQISERRREIEREASPRQKKTNLYIHLVLARFSNQIHFCVVDLFVYFYGKMFKGRSLQVYLKGVLLFFLCLTQKCLRKVCRVPFESEEKSKKKRLSCTFFSKTHTYTNAHTKAAYIYSDT